MINVEPPETGIASDIYPLLFPHRERIYLKYFLQILAQEIVSTLHVTYIIQGVRNTYTYRMFHYIYSIFFFLN